MQNYKNWLKKNLDLETLRGQVKAYFEEMSDEDFGVRLYIFTLGAQLLSGGAARWVLGYGIGTVAGFLGLGVSGGFLAVAAALVPIAWSASTFWFPGEGWLWRNLVGAREPSERELELIECALESLSAAVREASNGIAVYVIDTDDVFSFSRGRCEILSRGAVESRNLPALLAHEDGHLRSKDSIIMQALDRFVLWYGPVDPAGPRDRHHYGLIMTTVRWSLRWLVRIAGGAWTLEKLAPMWAAYLRNRELLADANAVSLGVGAMLAQHLRAWQQPKDCPNPRVLFNLQQYVPVAHRLDHLE